MQLLYTQQYDGKYFWLNSILATFLLTGFVVVYNVKCLQEGFYIEQVQVWNKSLIKSINIARLRFSYLLELFLVLNFFLEVKHDFLISLLKINWFQFVQSICDGSISKMGNSKIINSWWELWKIMLDFRKKIQNEEKF